MCSIAEGPGKTTMHINVSWTWVLRRIVGTLGTKEFYKKVSLLSSQTWHDIWGKGWFYFYTSD